MLYREVPSNVRAEGPFVSPEPNLPILLTLELIMIVPFWSLEENCETDIVFFQIVGTTVFSVVDQTIVTDFEPFLADKMQQLSSHVAHDDNSVE